MGHPNNDKLPSCWLWQWFVIMPIRRSLLKNNDYQPWYVWKSLLWDLDVWSILAFSNFCTGQTVGSVPLTSLWTSLTAHNEFVVSEPTHRRLIQNYFIPRSFTWDDAAPMQPVITSLLYHQEVLDLESRPALRAILPNQDVPYPLWLHLPCDHSMCSCVC